MSLIYIDDSGDEELSVFSALTIRNEQHKKSRAYIHRRGRGQSCTVIL